MKAQFLKISGHKNEKDFYKEFPTMEAFMAKHGAALKAQFGGNVTSFVADATSNMYKNKNDANNNGIPDLMEGPQGPAATNQFSYPQQFPPTTGFQQQTNFGAKPKNNFAPAVNAGQQFAERNPLPQSINPNMPESILGAAQASTAQAGQPKKGGFQTGIAAADKIIGGFKALSAEKKALKSAKQWKNVSGMALKASKTRDVNALGDIQDTANRTRKALIPTITGEELFPVDGVGTNVLTKYGGKLQAGGEVKRATKTAGKVIEKTAIGNLLNNIPYAETIYDAGNTLRALNQGDIKGVASNFVGALLPRVSGKAIEAIADEYIVDQPEASKKATRTALKISPGDAMKYLKKYGPGYANNPLFIKNEGKNFSYGGEIMNTFAPGNIYDDMGYEPFAESEPGYQPLPDEEIIKQYRSGGLVPRYQGGGGMGGGGFDFSSIMNMFGGSGGGGGAAGGAAGGSGGGGGGFMSMLGGMMGGGGGGGQQGGSQPTGMNVAMDTSGSAAGAMAGNLGGNNAGSQIGSGVADVVGMIPGIGPIAKAIAKPLFTGMGAILDKNPQRTKKYQRDTMMDVANMSTTGAIQGALSQYSGIVEDGGNLTNPQIITKFGEHDVDDLLKWDPMMDTLRTGGNIRSNKVGDIKIDGSRGNLRPISYNPYTEGTGITSMIEGPSHDRGGVNISYNGNMVEAEGGEPISERQDGGPIGEETAVITGDQTFNKMGAREIPELSEYEGKKVKHIQKDLAEKDARLNKLETKNSKALSDINPITPIDKLTFNSLTMNEKGINEQYKRNALKTQSLIAYQDAYNEEAKMRGVDAGELSRGRIKESDPEIAQNGITAKSDAARRAKMRKDMAAGMANNPDAPGFWSQIREGITDYLNRPTSGYGQAAPGFVKNKKGQWVQDPNYREPKKAAPKTEESFDTKLQKLMGVRPKPSKPKSEAELEAEGIKPIAPTRKAASNVVAASQAAAVAPSTRSTTPAQAKAKAKIAAAPTPEAKQEAVDDYVSEFGLETWKGNKLVTKDNPYGKKTASSFSTKEWDDIARNMGFKGKGNKEFQEFLFANPESRKLIEGRHKELYNKLPFIDEKLGYGWAADALKGLKKAEDPAAPAAAAPVPNDDGVYDIAPEERNPWAMLAGQILPWTRKTPGEPLWGDQLAGEMYAMSNNQLEPVQARFYHPQLDVPYDISLQDKLNENQASFRAIQRAVGNNPEALAALAGQKYGADSSVLADQFRMNQAKKDQVYSQNRQTLNDAQLKNLGIADTQYQRQAQAKSNTKAVMQEALNSVSSKIGQNRLENRTLQTYANMFPDFSYDKNYTVHKTGAPTDFNMPVVYNAAGEPTHAKVFDDAGNVIDFRLLSPEEKKTMAAKKKPSLATESISQDKKLARNGNLVKAFKNL